MASVGGDVVEDPNPDNLSLIYELMIRRDSASSEEILVKMERQQSKNAKYEVNEEHPPFPKSKENGEKVTKNCNTKLANRWRRKKPTKKMIIEELLAKWPDSLRVYKAKERLKNQDLENIKYIQGFVHVDTRYNDAYIPIPGEEGELLILGDKSRNKALDGDLVIASINPKRQWFKYPKKVFQKTGTIVCILEKIHSREAVGFLHYSGEVLFLQPRDKRIPLIRIRKNDPMIEDFLRNNTLDQLLFLVRIVGWTEDLTPTGHVQKIFGKTGSIETERKIILLEHNIDISPYSQELLDELPSPDYVLTELDIKDREDWRQECVFTIDPSTAVDLDDAVSCKLLENGNYEVGVHIADVTHFLKFLSPLDTEVAKRAVTVYLTDTAHQMLPKNLSEICSLLPGQERLTFSVIWEISPEAEIVKHRFAKTIIKSCCQMAYEQAQILIENSDDNCPDDLLHVNGDFNQSQLLTAVNELYKLSVHLRSKRFANGALCIDQPKLKVLLDKDTGLPNSYILEQQQESNRLIQEFMLLANMTVASHLYSVQPQTALLRSHTEPKKHCLERMKCMLKQFGVHLRIESSASLQESLIDYRLEMELKREEITNMPEHRMLIINNLCTKAMERAKYKCSSNVKTKEQLKHYALNVPLYTHFTSPIRRYVDCMVHRLLYSSINGTSLPIEWTKDTCTRIAEVSNMKKYNAKLAQDQCEEMYFAHLISLTGQPFLTVAMVAEVKKKHMTLVLCKTGIRVEITYADIEKDALVEYSYESPLNAVVVRWGKPARMEIFTIFRLARVELQRDLKHFRLRAKLLPPE